MTNNVVICLDTLKMMKSLVGKYELCKTSTKHSNSKYDDKYFVDERKGYSYSTAHLNRLAAHRLKSDWCRAKSTTQQIRIIFLRRRKFDGRL